MNDYKELIGKLRHYAEDADENIYGICVNTPKTMLLAAYAIEQLVRANAKLNEENEKLLIRAWVAERELLTHSSRISQLETENARLKAERDAALKEMPHICVTCRYGDIPIGKGPCEDCHKIGTGRRSNWEWRGVQKESE